MLMCSPRWELLNWRHREHKGWEVHSSRSELNTRISFLLINENRVQLEEWLSITHGHHLSGLKQHKFIVPWKSNVGLPG